jgi:hypothetical protein
MFLHLNGHAIRQDANGQLVEMMVRIAEGQRAGSSVIAPEACGRLIVTDDRASSIAHGNPAFRWCALASYLTVRESAARMLQSYIAASEVMPRGSRVA